VYEDFCLVRLIRSTIGNQEEEKRHCHLFIAVRYEREVTH